MPGHYVLDLFLGDFGELTRDLDLVYDAISFDVIPADVLGTGRLPGPTDGPVFWQPASWSLEVGGTTYTLTAD